MDSPLASSPLASAPWACSLLGAAGLSVLAFFFLELLVSAEAAGFGGLGDAMARIVNQEWARRSGLGVVGSALEKMKR